MASQSSPNLLGRGPLSSHHISRDVKTWFSTSVSRCRDTKLCICLNHISYLVSLSHVLKVLCRVLLCQDILVLCKTWSPSFINTIKLLELCDEFTSLRARNQPWALPPEHGTVDGPSISTSVHRRVHHIWQRPWGNSMRGDASCAIPQSWNPSPPSLLCSSSIHTLFSPQQCKIFSESISDTNL